MQLPDPRHGVRVVAGRVRDGVHVLRDRAGGLRAPPRRGRDRRAGAARPARHRRRACRTSCSWGWASRSPTTRRCGARSNGSTTDVGISARRLTISTVGVVPGIRRLASEDLPVTLAVSLHAPDDALRSQLVPLNRRYPIAEVLDAAAEFAAARGRRVTFEYACIDGVNDGPEHAAALGRRLAAWPGAGGAHVNLIPLNPTSEFTGAAPSQPRLRVFAERLRAAGVNATVRRNRGVDIDAACGQLRARQPIPPPSPQPIPRRVHDRQQWCRERTEVPQPVPAADPGHRDAAALHRRVLRPDLLQRLPHARGDHRRGERLRDRQREALGLRARVGVRGPPGRAPPRRGRQRCLRLPADPHAPLRRRAGRVRCCTRRAASTSASGSSKRASRPGKVPTRPEGDRCEGTASRWWPWR